MAFRAAIKVHAREYEGSCARYEAWFTTNTRFFFFMWGEGESGKGDRGGFYWRDPRGEGES